MVYDPDGRIVHSDMTATQRGADVVYTPVKEGDHTINVSVYGQKIPGMYGISTPLGLT